MSFFGLNVFQIPAALIGRRRAIAAEIPVNPVVYINHLPADKYVGCIIITDSLSGYGYDMLLPKLSGQNSYGIFSGKVGGPYADFDCMNTLMRAIHLPLTIVPSFIEFSDPASGTPYKIYVKYIRRVDLPRLNTSLRTSIAYNDFTYFTRFPLSNVSVHNINQTLNDDAGVSRFLNSSATVCVQRVVQNIHRFL
jgi:hypothetical protein